MLRRASREKAAATLWPLEGAVEELDRPVSVRGGELIVRHHQDRPSQIINRSPHVEKYSLARSRIQVSGRLIREQDRRLDDQGSRNRRSLKLSSRKCCGEVGPPVEQPNLIECFIYARLALALLATVEHQRSTDVFLHSQIGKEIKVLIDESDVASAEHGHLVVAHGGNALAMDMYRSLARKIQTRNQAEERGFS